MLSGNITSGVCFCVPSRRWDVSLDCSHCSETLQQCVKLCDWLEHSVRLYEPRQYLLSHLMLISIGIFTTASTNLVYSSNFIALIALYRPNLVVQPWMTFVAYQGFNVITSGIVMFGNKWMPAINKFSCWYNFLSFCSSPADMSDGTVCYLQLAWFAILVTVAATAPKHNDTEFVFRTWINETGWKNNVVCFITGLVNPLYSLGGLDGITVCIPVCVAWK